MPRTTHRDAVAEGSPFVTTLSFLLTAALFTAAFLATFAQALAADRGEDEGAYYYDRYAKPWVKAYAPPNTAPGTYTRDGDGEYPRGSYDHY